MAKRKSISKKVRFEVFKRDRFTCKWCGKSPVVDDDVVLEIDHAVPVSKGGDNNILNLVTSCFSCNRGKGATKIDDNTVIAQSKKQMDLLEEKREQTELIFKWHKEQQGIDEEKNDKVFQYINEILITRRLNTIGEKDIVKHIRKYKLDDVLKAIDISADTYLKFDENNELTTENACKFIDKIGGILHNMNQPIVKQKISYIKGICRNRFNNFDIRVGSIILNAYIKALEDYGCDEEIIVTDLDIDVIPITKEASSWSELRNIIEKWTDDVRRWTQERLEEEATSV